MRRFLFPLAVILSLTFAFTVYSAGQKAGTLKVATLGVALELKVADKPVPVPTGKDVPLPVGTYTPASITCYAQAPGKGKPELWSIKSTGPFGSLKEIEVAEGQTTSVEAGAPFTIKPSLATSAGRVVAIGMTIVGKAGEVYAPASIKKGQSSVPAPQVRILDEKGAVLAQGNLEYG